MLFSREFETIAYFLREKLRSKIGVARKCAQPLLGWIERYSLIHVDRYASRQISSTVPLNPSTAITGERGQFVRTASRSVR
jgi:hypothetical protein